MFRFNELVCKTYDCYSFVGIKKEGNKLIFCLPKGFEENEFQSFVLKKDLYFLLYKVLRQFKYLCLEKEYLKSLSSLLTRDRDGILQGEAGAQSTSNLDESIIFYSKLDGIGSLLDAYDELKILALAYRLGHSDRVDVSQIHKYLHKGIFLQNGTIYVDSMTLPRQESQFESTDIVAMYCYLVQEVKLQLEDEINPEVRALAENFQQRYLGIEDSLFVEQSYQLVVDSLKDALEIIDQRTAIKDSDYCDFYDAIEQFLYGNWQKADDGEIWGISNFHTVWESACLTYIVENVPAEHVAFLDRQFISQDILARLDSTMKLVNLSNIFTLKRVNIKPDIVISPSMEIEEKYDSQYSIWSDNWDDYGYKTSFKSSFFKDGYTKIAYIDQPSQSHTMKKLEDIYKEECGILCINFRLPKEYYSYWSYATFKKSVPEKSFSIQLRTMKHFNHVFYVAIESGYVTFDAFEKQLLPQLNINVIDNELCGTGVFFESLFREIIYDKLKKEFDLFLESLFKFEIIDIKYLRLSYLQDSVNIGELKERSIRKQFVYEYLLYQHLKSSTADDSSSSKISSSFWIPSTQNEDLSDGPIYLDGYLKLVTVDVESILEHYVN